MLGWHVSIYKLKDGGAFPATFESPRSARLAVWQSGIGGLEWINALVEAGKAVFIGGNGYPTRFTATTEILVPYIDTPPGVRTNWLCEAGDLVTNKWEGKTVVESAAVAQCRPDEWLLVEVWDES